MRTHKIRLPFAVTKIDRTYNALTHWGCIVAPLSLTFDDACICRMAVNAQDLNALESNKLHDKILPELNNLILA